MAKRIIIQCRVMSNRLPGKALPQFMDYINNGYNQRVKGYKDVYVCTTKTRR